MKLKWFFLFLLIGLPVGVYLFLQAFGENEFTIPIYFQEGLTGLNGCQNSHDSSQYKVDYLLSENQNWEKDRHVVYGFIDDLSVQELTNLHSFLSRERNQVFFVSLSSDSIMDQEFEGYSDALFLIDSVQRVDSIIRCSLRVDSDEKAHLVLCDSERRIRGYYDPRSLKEIDRLNTEIEILLAYE